MVSRQSVFAAGVMARVACVASPVARLVTVEVVEPLLTALRHRSVVTVVWIKAVVDVAVKPARAVEPGTGAKEHPANKPIRSIVAVRGTVIGSIVEVPVRAHRWWSNVDTDGHLGRRHRQTAEKGYCES
jgi:hypothetical protein